MKHNHRMKLEVNEDRLTMDLLSWKHVHKNEELEEEWMMIDEVD